MMEQKNLSVHIYLILNFRIFYECNLLKYVYDYINYLIVKIKITHYMYREKEREVRER